jgi:prepilin-type N-terminal cleavage/methylation domain-containing protein
MRRSGFTLVETLLVVVVAGIILAIGFPRMRDAKTKSDLRSARTTVASMYGRARNAAIETNRTSSLVFNGNDAVVVRAQAVGAALDTVGPVQNLMAAYGVTVTPTATTLQIDPRGIGLDAGQVVIRLTRGGYTDSLVISGFGRIQ